MLKRTLIAAATALAVVGSAIATVAPASAGHTGYIEIHGSNHWKGHSHKRGGFKHRRARRDCTPVIRWQKVGYRYHRRWQPVVVGWDCKRGRGHHHRRGHKRFY